MTRTTTPDGTEIGTGPSELEPSSQLDRDTRAALTPELLDGAVVLLGSTGGAGVVGLTGRSMLPTLKAGQQLSVEFSPSRLRVGDLLLFQQKDYLVVHRLVGRGRGSGISCRLKTRGDGVLKLDQDLDQSAILGRVVAVDDAEGRRDLRTRGARVYGRAVAWHNRFWAATGRMALVGDRVAAKIGLRGRFQAIVRVLDSWLLRAAHRLLFRRLHAPIYLEGDTTPTLDRSG